MGTPKDSVRNRMVLSVALSTDGVEFFWRSLAGLLGEHLLEGDPRLVDGERSR
jgi:hypothetical protein